MNHRGYQAIVEFNDEDRIVHGPVAGLRDVVTFAGESVAELKRAFRASVDDYLALGEAPDKPLSGQFMVRIGPELHCQAVIAAQRAGKNLNRWVAEAIRHEAA